MGKNKLVRGEIVQPLNIKNRKTYDAPNRSFALVLVDAILSRGNAAQMRNIAGAFKVTELVLV